MSFEVIEISPTQRKIIVLVEPAIVEQKRRRIFEEVKQYAQLPGFRPGKIPLTIIEKRFGKEINEQLKNELLEEKVQEFFKENSQWWIITQPHVSDLHLNIDSSFTFNIEVELIPEFELAEYHKLPLTQEKIEILPVEIEARLTELQKMNAEYRTITEERPVVGSDYVIIDFKGRVDLPEPQKSKLEEKMFAEAYPLHIGSGAFIPGFEAGLIGMNKNETKELEVVFPEDHHQQDLAGLKIKFQVTLKDIKEEKLLPIDDELAKDFGDFENLADLKQKIAQDIEDYKKTLATNKAKMQLRDKLVNINPNFPMPASLVKEQIDRLAWRDKFGHYINEEQGQEVPDPEAEREKYRTKAEWEVKALIILSKVAEKENLTASEEDVAQKVVEFAKAMGKKVEEIAPLLKEKNYIEIFKKEIMEEKALNYVYESAEITEVEVNALPEVKGES